MLRQKGATMLKVYIQANGFKMIGKAKDICKKLREYQQYHQTVDDFLLKNQHATKKSPFAYKHDDHSFTLITSKPEVPKLTNYYLLFPTKDRHNKSE